MGRVLSVNPDQPASIQTVVLDGVEYRYALTWRERTASWYLDLYDSEETPLALGRRLSPGWSLLLGLSVPDGPGGSLFVRGPEPYVRESLGASLRVVYYPVSEYPDPTADPEAPTVVLS